ncbi:MAG: SBBP repeat-containing protein, partial [Terracidiphilus sp.]
MLLAFALYIICPGALAQTSVGTVDVGAKTTVAATVTIFTAGTLAGIVVSTQGVPNLDFTNAGGGTCATGTAYAANSTCTVKVTFAPQFVGTRYGAIALTNSAGAMLGIAYLQGTGLGAQISYLPVGIGDGGNAVYLGCPIAGVAIDAAGSLYFTCPTTSAAYKETPTTTGYTSTQIAFGLGTPDGLYSPQGIAVDGAGNVYIADSTQNRVVKETPSAGGYTQSTVVTGL